MAGYQNYNDFEEEEEEEVVEGSQKKSNVLPIWGNEKTMNLNHLLLTNIQSSQYFKVKLYTLKTYHEVIDEIYYQVAHLEPWEKGSRKTSGQTGMCGGVRGVGAGGIVSTAFCCLYKLFTLRLTRKQLNGLLNNCDSPYIRGLGFMYIRYTQPPTDHWTWFEPYLDDEEEVVVRSGGGQSTSIGAVVRHLLTKLEWHATLFPRVPVPVQRATEAKLAERDQKKRDEHRARNTGGNYGGGNQNSYSNNGDNYNKGGQDNGRDGYKSTQDTRDGYKGGHDNRDGYKGGHDNRDSYKGGHDNRDGYKGGHDNRDSYKGSHSRGNSRGGSRHRSSSRASPDRAASRDRHRDRNRDRENRDRRSRDREDRDRGRKDKRDRYDKYERRDKSDKHRDERKHRSRSPRDRDSSRHRR